MMYRKTFLTIHKRRADRDHYNDFGTTQAPYYIIDEFRNILVDSHLSTLEEAREAKKRLAAKPEYSGTLPTALPNAYR